MRFRALHSFTQLLWFATSATCLTTFHTNCTLPDTSYNYVQEPNLRGTLSIIWSCLATLIACTYTVLHLSVPEQRDGRDSGFSGWLKWLWKRTYPSLLWMVITMIAPEYYAFVALENRGSARFFASRLKKLGEEMQPPGGWTTTHAFFAEMGGFAVRSNTTRRPQDITHLTGHSLLKVLELHHQEINFKYLPSKEDIEDRSKRDGFAKSLVIFQMVYFGVNCVTRLSSGLAVTQLEMSVLATAVCSLFSFALLFGKPHCVNTATVLLSFEGDMPELLQEVFDGTSQQTLHRSEQHTIHNMRFDGYVRSDSLETRDGLILFVPALALVLGSFHVAAWNFSFPTNADKWTWRVSSIVSCASAPSFLAVFCACLFLEGIAKIFLPSSWQEKRREIVELIFMYSGMVAAILYVASRCVLPVQVVRFLFFIPPGAPKTTWADNIPHI